jgi:serine/threonine-protein kinase
VQYEVRFDDKIAEGLIIRQTPEGGEETKPGRKVYLIISGGKEMAVVPDLRGKSLRDAKMALLKSNMAIGNVTYQFTDSAANGTVYRQSPNPGEKTVASAQVSLVVSEGQLMGRVPAPNLSHLTISQANEKLKAMKLELGKVTYQNGEPADAILDQYPPPGDLLTEGSSVDVFVARGGGNPDAGSQH